MENEYVFIKDGYAFTVFVVSVDLANGRYQIFSTSLNSVHHTVYETVAECEETFNRWVDSGRIDSWAKKWNPSMPSLRF